MATDEQIETEANRIWGEAAAGPSPTLIALRLSREGWEPVDEALLMARAVGAKLQTKLGLKIGALDIIGGDGDHCREVVAALAMHAAMIAAGYSKGREQERGAEKGEVATDAQFLCDRLDQLDFSLKMPEFEREWFGHVTPAIARLKASLEGIPW